MSEGHATTMNPRARAILWLDGGAGFVVGCLVIALRDWIAELQSLPSSLVLVFGLANLAYATYSGPLAMLAAAGRTPSVRAIDFLCVANAAWTFVCLGVLATHWAEVSALGIATVGFEGVFVGALAYVEYRFVRPFAR